MPRITIDNTDYLGRTSAPAWRQPHDPLSCRHCGSSLHGRRASEQYRQTSLGIAVVIEVFRCRCQRERRIEREAGK
jgi:hypothetical protein